MRYIFIFLLLFTAFIPSQIYAHEIKPGYLEITELTSSNNGDENSEDAHYYTVIWKSPIQAGAPLAVSPQFKEGCLINYKTTGKSTARVIVTQSTLQCLTPLEGSTVSFVGLDATLTDILLRFEALNGKQQTLRATPDQPSVLIEEEPSRWRVATTYFVLGVEHIWFGFDHLLFVLGLVLLINGKRRIVKTITAFTIAHSITLIATTLGLVNLSIEPVEAVIALSIVFLATEIACKEPDKESFTERKPWIVASAFGLLHGFGFASALSNIGMPYKDVPTALLTFNLGVEVGQLVFVAFILVLIWGFERFKLRRFAEVVSSYLIGSLSVFWLIQRVI